MMSYMSVWHTIFREFLLESECSLRGFFLKGVDAFELKISLEKIFMSAKQSIEMYKCSALEFLHRLTLAQL